MRRGAGGNVGGGPGGSGEEGGPTIPTPAYSHPHSHPHPAGPALPDPTKYHPSLLNPISHYGSHAMAGLNSARHHQDQQDVLKPASAFTIDNILKSNTTEEQHLKQLRDFNKSMDILRSHYHYHLLGESASRGSGASRPVLQFNHRAGMPMGLHQVLGHLPAYTSPLWSPLGLPPSVGGFGAGGGATLPPAVNQAVYMEAINRWLLTTAQMGSSVPPTAPRTPPAGGQTCTEPHYSCAQ